jgi:hypothetical protein
MVIFTKKVEILDVHNESIRTRNNRTEVETENDYYSTYNISKIIYQKSYYLFGILFWKAKLIDRKVLGYA